MTLKDMIDRLRHPQHIEIRNAENNTICCCGTHSEGVLPYIDREVIEWFAGHQPGMDSVDFVVGVKAVKTDGKSL